MRDVAQTMIYVCWLVPAGFAVRIGWGLGEVLFR